MATLGHQAAEQDLSMSVPDLLMWQMAGLRAPLVVDESSPSVAAKSWGQKQYSHANELH